MFEKLSINSNKKFKLKTSEGSKFVTQKYKLLESLKNSL